MRILPLLFRKVATFQDADLERQFNEITSGVSVSINVWNEADRPVVKVDNRGMIGLNVDTGNIEISNGERYLVYKKDN